MMAPTTPPSGGGTPPIKPNDVQLSRSSGSNDDDDNSISSVLDMLEEKRRLSEHYKSVAVSSSSPRASTSIGRSHPRPQSGTDATAATDTARLAVGTRNPPNAKTRRVVVVVRSRSNSSSLDTATFNNTRRHAVAHRLAPVSDTATATATAASTRPTVHPRPDTITRKTTTIPTPTKANQRTVGASIAAVRRRSSISTTTCTSSDDSTGSDGNSRDGMTVLEILEEKRQYQVVLPVVPRASPAHHDDRNASSAATTTTTTNARQSFASSNASAVVPCLEKKQQQEQDPKQRRRGQQQQRRQNMEINSHTDDRDSTSRTRTTTMPGAVFVPGISQSFYSINDAAADDNVSVVLDFPELLRQGHSSSCSCIDGSFSSSPESVHLGVAVAVTVDNDDEQQQVPRVVAVPRTPTADKDKVPFHKTNFCFKIALILLTAILITVVATITIILVAGYHDSEEGYREKLGIRQEIEALIGTEKLESAQSPYTKALEWLIHQDPMELVPGIDSNLFQRYIMAYFYYATTTNGPWRFCNPAVGDELEVCNRIKAYGDGAPGNVITTTRWLSSVHECQFAGVVCNGKMQVVGLELNNQRLSGGFPVGIVHLPFLESIAFPYGDLYGPLPKDIANLEHLVHINIAHNKLTGEIPVEWWQPRLLYMNLEYNAISGSIPPEIKVMTNLKSLVLEGNKFTGTIPKEIVELKSLESFLLAENSLKGPIPAEFGQLKRLLHLTLHSNLLTGSLPQELGNLKLLCEFSVNKNSLLGGDIPDDFYNMKRLAAVDLSECNFTGTISPSIGNLKQLNNFKINDNFFTGTIPVELARADMNKRDQLNAPFVILEVQNNNFHGKMPQEICERGLHTLIADCIRDLSTGDVELQCDCCTACCETRSSCTPLNEWGGYH